MDVAAQSRLALAAQAREAADRLHDLVGLTSTPLPPGGRSAHARDIRLLALHLQDLAVLADVADGATWADIADTLRLPETFVRDRYEDLLPAWAAANDHPTDGTVHSDHVIGLVADDDPAGTAAMLDQWWQRHAEPWQAIDDAPVSRALAGA